MIYTYKYIFRSNSCGLAPLGPSVRPSKFINLASRGTIVMANCLIHLPLESELCLEALASASSLGGNSPAIPLSLESKLVFL